MQIQTKLVWLLFLIYGRGMLLLGCGCENVHEFGESLLEQEILRDVGHDPNYTKEYESSVLKNNPVIIPIGVNCRAARRLAYLEVRYLSYPFDWYSNTLEQIYHLIENDFVDFLNPQCLVRNKKGFIASSKYQINLIHDFPNHPTEGDMDWRKIIVDVQRKYQRRIDRFYRTFYLNKPIYLFRADDQVDLPSTELWLKKLVELLEKKFPYTQFTVIAAARDPLIETLTPIPHVKTVRYFHHPWNDNTPWDESAYVKIVRDEWMPIFKKLGIIQ